MTTKDWKFTKQLQWPWTCRLVTSPWGVLVHSVAAVREGKGYFGLHFQARLHHRGKTRWKLKTGTWRQEPCELAHLCSSLVSLFPDPGNVTPHSGPGPPTSITNHDSHSHTCPSTNAMQHFSVDFFLSHDSRLWQLVRTRTQESVERLCTLSIDSNASYSQSSEVKERPIESPVIHAHHPLALKAVLETTPFSVSSRVSSFVSKAFVHAICTPSHYLSSISNSWSFCVMFLFPIPSVSKVSSPHFLFFSWAVYLPSGLQNYQALQKSTLL